MHADVFIIVVRTIHREIVAPRAQPVDGKLSGGAHTRTNPWPGHKFLLARRLVEAGVAVVTLRVGTWDYHGKASGTGNIFTGLKSQLPLLDRSIHAAYLTERPSWSLPVPTSEYWTGEVNAPLGDAIVRRAGRRDLLRKGRALLATTV